jgi:hypothetical protein
MMITTTTTTSPTTVPLLASCLLLVTISSGSTSGSSNLVVNPSFELRSTTPPAGTNNEPARGWQGSSIIYTRVTDVVRAPSTAALRYSNHNPSAYATCSQRVQNVTPGHRYSATIWVKTVNITGPDAGGASLCVEFQPFQPAKFPNGYYPAGVTGTSDWTQVSALFNVPRACGGGDPSNCRVVLSAYVRQGDSGVAYFDQVTLTELGTDNSWVNMETVVRSPVFRGQITSSCQAPIRLRAHLEYELYGHTAAHLELIATLSTSHSRVVAGEQPVAPLETVTIAGVQPTVDISFSKTKPSSLLPGAYLVNVTLRNSSSGVVLSSSAHNLTRLADTIRHRNGSWIDEKQRLIVDGTAFFPIGLYLSSAARNPPGWNSSVDHLVTIGESKFNTIMPCELLLAAWNPALRTPQA